MTETKDKQPFVPLEKQESSDGDDDPFPGTDTPSAYIAIDGISPNDISESDKEQLIIYLQNRLLADFGYPIEGVRLIESPRYAVEFIDNNGGDDATR